jgi:hypothetical protein
VAYANARFNAVHGDASPAVFLGYDVSEYGYFTAMTSDDNFNILVTLRLGKVFGVQRFLSAYFDSALREQSQLHHLPAGAL